jgi:hypothetical protein
MACTMNMLAPFKMKSPPGAIPAGLKVTCLATPDVLTPPPGGCPVLSVGSFILCPFSYIDNRVSFGMVMYNPQGSAIKTIEKPGARYIYKITLNVPLNSVTFSGQANQSVTMSLDEICGMLT